MPTTALLFPIYLFSFLSTIHATLVNVTVDDASPDPMSGSTILYSPVTAWTARNSTQVCNQCIATPDPGKMNGGTWHDNSYFPTSTDAMTASFTFSGTALYVYCALALQTTSDLAAFTNMTFFIDGEQVGQFQRIPPGTSGFWQYKVSVYSNSSIPPGTHKFTLQNGVVGNGGQTSLALFDYLVYSYDNSVQSSPTTSTSSLKSSTTSSTSNPTSSASSSKTGVIVGGILGVICGLTIIALAIRLFIRRRRQSQAQLHPFDSLQTSQPSPMTAKRANDGVTSHALSPSSVALSSTTVPLPPPSHSDVREQDAGPVALGDHNRNSRMTLPPDYGQVFSQSQEDLRSSGPRPVFKQRQT